MNANLPNSLSLAIQPVNQFAPHPFARKLFNIFKHKAPHERICSISGIFVSLIGEQITVTIKGVFDKLTILFSTLWESIPTSLPLFSIIEI